MPDDTGQPGPDGQPSPDQAAQDWRQDLPEDIRGEKTFEKFVKDGKLDFGNVARSYSSLEKKQGGSITVPGEGADEATVKEFYKKLGVPDGPEGYTPTLPDLHVGWNWDGNLVKEWQSYAHKEGLTPKQFQAGINFYATYQNFLAEAVENAVREGDSALQKEYGVNYPRVKELARRAFMTFDQEGGGAGLGKQLLEEFLPKGQPPRHAGLVKLLAWLGERGAEAGFIDARMEGAPSKAEAIQELAQMNTDINNKNNALWNGQHPGHDAAVARKKVLDGVIKGV